MILSRQIEQQSSFISIFIFQNSNLREILTLMLLRLFVENFRSFGSPVELNTFPNKKIQNHPNHIKSYNDVDSLKMTVVYGANASGKSNLFRALEFIQSLVVEERIPNSDYVEVFALSQENIKLPFKIAVEFISQSTGFLYGIEIKENVILCEELYESGLGQKEDQLIFRKQFKNGKSSVEFSDSFNTVKENLVLVNLLEKSILKKDVPILQFLTTLENESFKIVEKAVVWFKKTLTTIKPKEEVSGLVFLMATDPKFFDFVNQVMTAYHVGIERLEVKKTLGLEFFGLENVKDIEDLEEELRRNDAQMILLRRGNDEICAIKESGKLYVLQLKLVHFGCPNEDVMPFNIGQESDGTRRLLDFLPAFYFALKYSKVFCIDEIGRSIHPMLIKELLLKFSTDKTTVGQIIFSTHESHLLDQSIFRRDEIWFTEKKKNGETTLYSLSDYKEHNTKNIQKGYLNGRYGAIPFLGNLRDLEWKTNDTI